MTGPRIRLAELADAEQIAAVQARGREAAYRDLEPNTWMDGWTQERRVAAWSDRLSRSGAAVWVAEHDDATITGFCALVIPSRDDDADEDTAEVAALYVDPATWRSGVGRALMEVALGQLADRGFSEVPSGCSRPTPGPGRSTSDSGSPPTVRPRRCASSRRRSGCAARYESAAEPLSRYPLTPRG